MARASDSFKARNFIEATRQGGTGEEADDWLLWAFVACLFMQNDHRGVAPDAKLCTLHGFNNFANCVRA